MFWFMCFLVLLSMQSVGGGAVLICSAARHVPKMVFRVWSRQHV